MLSVFFKDEISFPAGAAIDRLNRIHRARPVFHDCNELFVFTPVLETVGSQSSYSVPYGNARTDMSVELYSSIKISVIEFQVSNSYFNFFFWYL
ncbi:hypothetical protein MSSAC_0354 [Methanosarcina siciliae C2J]|uniref:Uncharacterized protein n=1 Tax=Methanosarcina siciliae C2J TaxID=1434118 RepID=A0A0E3PJY2_9EURY|nr:hypothetical protein MSSAC_0354 [Methanosarcina siciliae C2J]